MSATVIDPTTALVLVDFQRGVVRLDLAHAVDAILGRARMLADSFRRCALPVVLVNVEGFAPGRVEQPRVRAERPADWAELVPELGLEPGDYRVTKRTWGAFSGTDLERYLKGRGVTQVVVAGIATSIGVESTARQAYERGFHVTLAVDAMTDMNAEAHLNSVARIFPRLGETATTEEILALLDRRSA